MSDVHLHNGLRYSVNSEGRCDWYNCTHNVYNSFDAPEVDYEAEFLDPQQFDEATRDANDDDSGPTYREMLARNAENMDREYIDRGVKRNRPSFATRVDDFWLLAEPAYQRFDELTKARINRALEVFKDDYDG